MNNPFDPKTGEAIAAMTNAFLRWPLPDSVRVDACCLDTKAKHRTGTNLLTVVEALQMFQEVVCPIIAEHAPVQPVAEGQDTTPFKGEPLPDAEEYAKHVARHLYPDGSNAARLIQIALNEWLNRHRVATREDGRDGADKAQARLNFILERISVTELQRILPKLSGKNLGESIDSAMSTKEPAT